jgi:hypothetical protein
VKKFLAYGGNFRFITVGKTAHYFSLRIPELHFVSSKTILIL